MVQKKSVNYTETEIDLLNRDIRTRDTIIESLSQKLRLTEKERDEAIAELQSRRSGGEQKESRKTVRFEDLRRKERYDDSSGIEKFERRKKEEPLSSFEEMKRKKRKKESSDDEYDSDSFEKVPKRRRKKRKRNNE